jgi:hypothetical protein
MESKGPSDLTNILDRQAIHEGFGPSSVLLSLIPAQI